MVRVGVDGRGAAEDVSEVRGGVIRCGSGSRR